MKDIDSTIYDAFSSQEYKKTALLTINTTLVFEGIKRELIQHNKSQFVWVNGNERFLPYIIVPLRERDYDDLYEYSKDEIFNDILDYLSLLTVRFGIPVEMHQKYFKNYYSLMEQVLIYHEPWIEREMESRDLLKRSIPVYIKELSDNDKVMTGLFRDAICSANIFYSILSCFKIFEYYFPDYKDRNNWIAINFNEARTFSLKNNIMRGLGDFEKFQKFVINSRKTYGEYLYKECRLAIAHATKKDIFKNPNKYVDYYEMYYSNEVLKVLSLYLILEKLDDKLFIKE